MYDHANDFHVTAKAVVSVFQEEEVSEDQWKMLVGFRDVSDLPHNIIKCTNLSTM